MRMDVCVFCHRLENGKLVSLCSRYVQKLLIASPEKKIAVMKQADSVTEIMASFTYRFTIFQNDP